MPKITHSDASSKDLKTASMAPPSCARKSIRIPPGSIVESMGLVERNPWSARDYSLRVPAHLRTTGRLRGAFLHPPPADSLFPGNRHAHQRSARDGGDEDG